MISGLKFFERVTIIGKTRQQLKEKAVNTHGISCWKSRDTRAVPRPVPATSMLSAISLRRLKYLQGAKREQCHPPQGRLKLFKGAKMTQGHHKVV